MGNRKCRRLRGFEVGDARLKDLLLPFLSTLAMRGCMRAVLNGMTYRLQVCEHILAHAILGELGLDGSNDLVDDRPICIGLNDTRYHRWCESDKGVELTTILFDITLARNR
jgi:hypothetical protein